MNTIDHVKIKKKTKNNDMKIEALIRENSGHLCDKCEYKAKLKKSLKI